MSAVGIVTAAGRAERFGGGKLIADIDGEPLLNRTLRSLLDGGLGLIVVVLPPGATLATVGLLNDPRVRRVINPDPDRGMFSSVQIGLAAEAGDPILVLPGDMPFVRPTTVAEVLAEATRTGRIVSPRFQGRNGHPIAIPGRLKPEILKSEVTSTLAEIIDAHAALRTGIDVDDPGVLRDVDEKKDLS